MRRLLRACTLLALSLLVTSSGAIILLTHADAAPSIKASSLQAPGEPVAVIGWLPDEVSNGTWWNLDASQSHDPDGIIANYTWSISISNVTSYLYGQGESFKFKTLGLYKIKLTVRDTDGNNGTAFTAVYSIVDLDKDGLPDWWEMEHFYSIADQSGSDDFDHDGYTNLQEYAAGTDPTTKNPQPTLIQNLKDNWMYLAIIAAIIIAIVLALWPVMKKRRKQDEKRKIEAAIEIEKALESEE
jgi:hypothetical protein